MSLTAEKEAIQTTTISSKIGDYAAFIKLRLASLVVFSAVLGYMLAVPSIDWSVLTILCIGGFLVTGSSNGFNQIIERDLDKLMDRTKGRPLVVGTMSVTESFLVASISGLIGIVMLLRCDIYPTKKNYSMGCFCWGFSGCYSSYAWLGCCYRHFWT